MTPRLTKLIGYCVPCSGRQQDSNIHEEAMVRYKGLSTEDLHFVIPIMDFPKYETRRPENGTELSVGEFMFFYRYITTEESFKQPGPGYDWVMFFFRDSGSIHLMKGWVPTKKKYVSFKLEEQKLISNFDKKAKLLLMNNAAKLHALESQNSSFSKCGSQSPSIHPGYPERKSAYNWGVINTWSRHVAPESDDNVPFNIDQNSNLEFYSSASMSRLTKEIYAAIEGKPIKGTSTQILVAKRYQVSDLAKFCGDYLSTIVTTENACKILGISLCHNLTNLRDACCSYIDQNAEGVLNSEGIVELSKDALLHILKGDTFYAQEDAIFLKAEEWAVKRIEERGLERNGATIKQILGESFYYLRLPTMTYKMLMTSTRNKGYFTAEEYIDMADFINGLPDTRIVTNSCVARSPVTETLLVKMNAEKNENVILPGIRFSFQVSASKDTELVSFGLSCIQPYRRYYPVHYVETPNSVRKIVQTGSTLESATDYHKYSSGKVIRLFNRRKETNIVELDEIAGEDLRTNIRLECCISCRDLGIDQKLTIDSTMNINEQLHLKPPIILRKSDSTYWVSVTFSNKCSNEELKTQRSILREDVKSKTGHVKISGNYLEGIESITIKKFANREAES